MEPNKLKVGQGAPEFCLPDHKEKKICLKDFKGRPLVVYFYPKDNTPTCTIEAVDFSTQKSAFEKEKSAIIGISRDSCRSHQNFINKKNLTITLLSDPDMEVHKRYDVWRMKKFMGRESMGTVRTTFLINSEGKIAKIWDGVRVKGHVEEVLDELKKLNN
jgi:peroxiredoxin Q/BCP